MAAFHIVMKTEGELQEKMEARWINPSVIFFIIMYALTTMATLIYMPHMIEVLQERPLFFLLAILNLLAIANIPREISLGNYGRAFLSSCLNIICLIALYGIRDLSESDPRYQRSRAFKLDNLQLLHRR